MQSGPVRMTYVAIETDEPQLALAVGRRFGPAVERNRARRRLRHAFTAAQAGTPAPLGAYLMTANRSVLSAPFPSLVAAVERCLTKLAAGPAVTGARP